MRRVTHGARLLDGGLDISIHALHEESDYRPQTKPQTAYISIHALHEESDARPLESVDGPAGISIHALHEESDARQLLGRIHSSHFNPRSP